MEGVVVSVLLLLLIGLTSAGVVYDRPCRTEIEAQQYFSLEAYLGKWYELQRYRTEYELNYECIQVTYAANNDDTVTVTNNGYHLFYDSIWSLIGRAVLSFPDEPVIEGKLNVTYDGEQTNYWILETDYHSYSLAWTCQDQEGNRSEESFWLLSRTPTLTSDRDALFRINSIMRRYMDREEIRFTEQVDLRCPVF